MALYRPRSRPSGDLTPFLNVACALARHFSYAYACTNFDVLPLRSHHVPTHKSPIRFTHHTLDIRKSTHEKGQKCQQFVEEREKENPRSSWNRKQTTRPLQRQLKNERKRINYARHQNDIPTYKHADRRRYNSLAASAFLRISEQTAPFLSKEIPPGTENDREYYQKNCYIIELPMFRFSARIDRRCGDISRRENIERRSAV